MPRADQTSSHRPRCFTSAPCSPDFFSTFCCPSPASPLLSALLECHFWLRVSHLRSGSCSRCGEQAPLWTRGRLPRPWYTRDHFDTLATQPTSHLLSRIWACRCSPALAGH